MQLQEVSFGFKNKTLLSKVNLSIHSGERLAIVGDNGEGKSTLIKLLMGLHKPSSGQRVQNIRKTKISYVTQRPSKNFSIPMRVEEFLKLGLIGIKNIDSARRVLEILNQIGLSERIHDDISILSGGQFQRLVLGRAIIREPELMFLDEPTTGLDRHASREFMTELERQCQNMNMTSVMVLHNFRYLERDFSRLAWIHDGIVEVDTVEHWFKTPAFADFIGRGGGDDL